MSGVESGSISGKVKSFFYGCRRSEGRSGSGEDSVDREGILLSLSEWRDTVETASGRERVGDDVGPESCADVDTLKASSSSALKSASREGLRRLVTVVWTLSIR